MNDARWIEVDDEIDDACIHFANSARLFDEGGFDGDDLAGYRARMALLHAMQSGQTSLESALKRILRILGEEVPVGEQSHADIIRRTARPIDREGHRRPAMLSPEVARDADETRRFRHRAMHDYGNFDPLLAVPAIAAARRLSMSLKPCIAVFRQQLDPPTAS